MNTGSKFNRACRSNGRDTQCGADSVLNKDPKSNRVVQENRPFDHHLVSGRRVRRSRSHSIWVQAALVSGFRFKFSHR